jgi:hypothetical protein
MKEIVYRGGLVKFFVPESWIEEYEPSGGGTFHENSPNSGTLRLNVITATTPKEVDTDTAFEALKLNKDATPEFSKRLPNGNAVGSWVTHGTDRGEAISQFWWEVVNPVPPHHIRLANFSYTVLATQEKLPNVVNEVKLLNDSIEQLVFYPSLGEQSINEGG